MIKNNLKYILMFALIACLTVWTVCRTSKDFALDRFAAELANANPVYIVMAILMMLGFIVFEGLGLVAAGKDIGIRVKAVNGIDYAAADVFFSAITPSASGGQPASAFLMMWDKLPMAETTIILLINLIMYSYSNLLVGAIAMATGWSTFSAYSGLAKFLVFLGAILVFGLSILFWLLIVKDEIVKRISEWFIALGVKLHIVKQPEKHRDRLELTMVQYRGCAEAINSGSRINLAKCFLHNMLQRICHTFVGLFCFLAAGGTAGKTAGLSFKAWVVTTMSDLGANSIPIPGGMGVTDFLLVHGFGSVEGINNATNLALMTRGISFYSCILVSVIIFTAGYWLRVKKLR